MLVPRRILHVDDDPQITQLVAEYLSDYGYQTTALHEPREVLQRLPRFQERVILLDIDMPRMSGMELLRDIKAFDAGIQVIMLTGVVTMTTVLQSLRFGAEACFFKPVTEIEPLVEALSDVFRKLDRWWGALEDLRRRKVESASPAGVSAILP